MFCNTILSKFQSESVLSDCVFACETIEVVIIAPELPCAAPLPFILVGVLKRLYRIFFFFCHCNLNSEGVYLHGNHKLREVLFHFSLGSVFWHPRIL